MKKGTIQSISSDMSGLQTIKFEDGKEVLIENFGVRQLVQILENPIGETILYEVDEYNTMTNFDFEESEK